MPFYELNIDNREEADFYGRVLMSQFQFLSVHIRSIIVIHVLLLQLLHIPLSISKSVLELLQQFAFLSSYQLFPSQRCVHADLISEAFS